MKQQKVSEQTNQLVESMLQDVRKAREQSERLAILANRVETLERAQTDWDRKRTECMVSVNEQLRDLEVKREQNKDKIYELEQSLLNRLSTLKSEVHSDLKSAVDPVGSVVGELREKIAFSAGKYGAVVALVISMVMMLVQYLLTHHTGVPPKP